MGRKTERGKGENWEGAREPHSKTETELRHKDKSMKP